MEENKMKRLMTVLCTLLLFAFLTPIASAAPIDLFDAWINVDGSLTDLKALFPSFVLGTVSVTINPGIAGDHFIGAFLDYEIDEEANTFFNEFGDVSGAPPAGFSWEIDEPGYVFGDIFANFSASDGTGSALDNTNAVPSSAPEDVSIALGWNFSLTASQVATFAFTVSETAPQSAFYLVHTDPDSDASIYLSSTLNVREGGEPVIPEPGTWVLLLTGLTMVGVSAKRFGKRS
jgi:hypothetical protein